MVLFLILHTESIIQVQAKYTCVVGQEHKGDFQWQWVLPYKNPCECSKIWYGGANIYTPKRPFEPVYVKEPLIDDNISESRGHALNRLGK